VKKEVRILFVIRTLLRAGAERMLVNTCNELMQRSGFKIAVYTVNPGNEFQELLDPRVLVQGGDVTFHFSLYKKNRFKNNNYIDFAHSFKPDIIHSHLHYGDLLAHSYYYHNAVYFSHQHNSEVQEYNALNWKKVFNKRMWSDYYEFYWLKDKFKKHQTDFIACSAGTQEMLKNRIGLGKITTLPNAIPIPELKYVYKSLNNVIINLIWVGRLSDVKRPELAIHIAKELHNRNVRFSLKIIGEGHNFNKCIDLINKYQLNERVEMCGLVNDMDSIYSKADLLIHTAIYEGLPMVFIEANSFGVPIISSDCIPNNEILVNGENGNIIYTDNPIAFSDTIEKIYKSQLLYEKLSKNSIQAAKNYGIQKYVDRLIKIYNTKI
jgi:glycosyltransferase involved in cell wall biosynthesis